MDFKNYLKSYRLNHSLTQEQMAIKLKTTKSYYNLIENGKLKAGISMIKRLSKLLKITPAEIRRMYENN